MLDANQNVDLLIPEQSQATPYDPLMEKPKEDNNGTTAVIAAKLALLDESIGQNYDESYKARYMYLSNLSVAEQEAYSYKESLAMAKAKTIKDIQAMSVDIPTTEEIQGQTRENTDAIKSQKEMEFQQRVLAAASNLSQVNYDAMPIEKQIEKMGGLDNIQDLPIQEGIDLQRQFENEAAVRISAKVGATFDQETGEWGYKSKAQWTWEAVKGFFLPFRQNIGGWDMNKLIDKYNRSTLDGKRKMIPMMEQAILEYADGDVDIAELATSKWLAASSMEKDLVTEIGFSPLYFTGYNLGARLKGGASAVKALAARGARRQAGNLNAAALTSTTGSVVSGTSTTTARVIADPLLGGLAPETVAGIEASRLRIQGEVANATADVTVRSPLTLAEQETFINSTKAKIPRSVSIAERDETGFKLVLDDGTKTQRITFTRDGIGQLDGVNELSAVGSRTLSPSAIFRGTARENVGLASRVELEQSGLSYNLGKIIDRVMETRIRDRLFTGMGSQEWTQLDGVLTQGDRLSKTFSARELLAGVHVEGTGVVSLSERQIAKYFEVRQVYDELYRIRDRVYISDLEFRGFRGIYTKVDGKPMSLAGKQAFATTDQMGLVSINVPADVRRVAYNTRTGLVGKNVDPKWANSTAGSYVKFDKPVKIGNEIFEYGFISNNMLKDIKPGMLGFREGYVPLYYNRVNYVVRQAVDRTVNGAKRRGTEVRRFFNTREEAEQFANAANTSITDKTFHYTVATDREIRATVSNEADDYVKQVEEAAYNGRYFQARNEDPIRYGISDMETPRMSAMDSLNRYTRAMSWAYPQTAFRQRMISEFQNTYGKHLSDPTDWRSSFKANSGLTTAQQNGIQKYRDSLKDWLSVRTEEETFFNNIARHAAESLEGGIRIGGKTVVSSERLAGTREKLMRGGDMDIVSTIKGATHHAMLGMYGMSQFFVQGLGLTIAASVDPKNFLKALPRISFLRATAYIHPSAANYEKVIESLAKVSGVDVAEAKQMAEMFRKSGLARSLRNTSADYNAAENGLVVTKGMLGRVADSGLVFYREGELLNRITSYGIGWLRAKELEKAGKLVGSLDELAMKEYYKVSFNLQKSNAASFQKGWMSIPTQYYQITAKYLEHMVPGLLGKEGAQWSRKEALSSLAVGTLLFGTTGGIPFGKYLTSNIRNYVMGDPENGGLGVKDEKMAVAIQGGLIDLWLGNLLGLGDAYASLSSRAGIASGVVETIDRWRENPTVLEAISGATGSLASRSFEAAHTAMRILTTKGTPEDNFTMQKVELAASELGRVVSSWRNIHTARMWANNQAVLNSKNREVYPLDVDPERYWMLSNGEVFAKAIGFDSTRRGWERDISNEARATDEDMDNAIASMRELYSRLSVNGQVDPKYLEIYEAGHVAIRNSFSTEEDKAAFDKRWIKSFKEDPKLQRSLQDLIDSDAPLPEELETNPLVTNNISE